MCLAYDLLVFCLCFCSLVWVHGLGMLDCQVLAVAVGVLDSVRAVAVAPHHTAGEDAEAGEVLANQAAQEAVVAADIVVSGASGAVVRAELGLGAAALAPVAARLGRRLAAGAPRSLVVRKSMAVEPERRRPPCGASAAPVVA